MFFAVVRYGAEDRYSNDNIAVLDTIDCTVEVISCDEASDHGVVVEGLYKRRFATDRYLCIVGYPFGTSEQDFNGGIYLSEYEILHIQDMEIDCSNILQMGKFELSYPFTFRDYIVIRAMHWLDNKLDWKSAVFDKKGNCIAVWNKENPNCSLAVQIDTISEV